MGSVEKDSSVLDGRALLTFGLSSMSVTASVPLFANTSVSLFPIGTLPKSYATGLMLAVSKLQT